MGKSFKSRIFYCILFFVVIPFIAITYLTMTWLSSKVEENNTQLLQQNTIYLNGLCQSVLVNIKNTAAFIYNDNSTMDILTKTDEITEMEQGELNRKIAAIFYSDDDIESISFYVDSIQLIIYKNRDGTSRFYQLIDGEEGYFKYNYPTDNPQYSITNYLNGEEGKQFIVLNQNIMNLDYKTVARLEVVYESDIFEPIFANDIENDASAHFIVKDNGEFIYEEFSESLSENMSEDIVNASEGVTFDDENKLIYIKYKMEPFDYYVVKCVTYEGVVATDIPYFQSILIILCIMIIIIGLVAIFLSKLIQRPVKKFTDSIIDFRGNSEKVRVEEYTDIEEMQGLSYQFTQMMNEINELIEQKSIARYNEKATNLRMMILQINPHFLYNSLQTLQFMAAKRNAFEITTMLTSLGKILRYSLDNETEIVSLEQEMDNVREYLNMQKFRYVDELQLKITKPESLRGGWLPKMTLQPIVENCFVHGLKKKDGDFAIGIVITREESKYIIRIQDNGNILADEKIEELRATLEDLSGYIPSQHTGLKSVRYRLLQKFPEFKMNIWNDSGFVVQFEIDIIENIKEYEKVGQANESIDN